MRAEVQWWLETSDRDEQMARQLFASGFYEGCAFHCQQAAKKTLKASLLAHGYAERLHSCLLLLQAIEGHSIAPVPPHLFTIARQIDAHYLEPRYPNAVGGSPHLFYDETIAREVIQWMERLKEFARSLIP